MGRIHDPARVMRERLLLLERRATAKAEARAVEEGVAETVALSEARGAAFAAPEVKAGGRPGSYRRQTGLAWLSQKGRLTARQAAAGERYGAAYRRVGQAPSLGSTLEIQPGSAIGGPDLDAILRKARGRERAAERLAFYRRRLWEQEDLIRACDQVCGQELTPREASGGDRDAARLEAVLKVALDILALP